jgi:hypothetical protein
MPPMKRLLHTHETTTEPSSTQQQKQLIKNNIVASFYNLWNVIIGGTVK